MSNKIHHLNSDMKIKWKNDLDRPVVNDNCLERNWKQVSENDDDFNFYWAGVANIRTIFNPKFKYRLRNNQMINHFPNHYEITRKDLLAKNIKRFKPLQRTIILESGDKMDLKNDFIPPTFLLPTEYSIFLEEFTRNNDKKWIFKPAGSAQGKGIQIITKYSQVKSLPMVMSSKNSYKSSNYVISRYLDDPFLIDGKKFDLRTYVLVTSYKPLKVWRYTQGFARICFEDYINLNQQKSGDPNQELFGHLTNVSFQKYSNKYNEIHGGKWPLTNLFELFEREFGRKKTEKLKKELDCIYLSSLKAVQPVMNNDKHCFELYGFDTLIDNNLKPWLIEVNASPSLIGTTKYDFMFKKKLISDLIDIIIPPNWNQDKHLSLTGTCKEKKVGLFNLLYNESKDPLNLKINRPKTSINKIRSNKYY